ncbi:hypothetical protein TNIN_449131 [Trichonephila inaurata madagascariensis]|uniref:Uncharacterized protein n=1 Tax=Trichonephila inaurata madagascariensis TaxID=2747483 RepID=A0A8X7CBD5_9ARAC|nr:hypothetical protein TNIN_449131 [Trichonephila inaurata madagascariensis]
MTLSETLQSSSLERLLLFHTTPEEGVAEERSSRVERRRGRRCSRDRVEKGESEGTLGHPPEKKGRREWRGQVSPARFFFLGFCVSDDWLED